MKTYYQKSESDRAIGGIEAVQMSDEHYEQLKGVMEFVEPDSKEALAYIAVKAQAAAAAQLERLMAAVQGHIDAPAKELGYDSMVSMASYAASTVPKFASEAKAGIKYRDDCWSAAYKVQQAVQAATRGVPTPEELLAELPTWTGA